MSNDKIKIQNTNDTTIQKIKCVILGEYGSGKTSLAGTLSGKTLLISAESGHLSLMGKDIDFVDITRDEDGALIREPALRLQRLTQVYSMLVADKTPRWDNIFIDSLSEIYEIILAIVEKEFPDRKDSFPMWGEYNKRMQRIVKAFRDLPNYNVFMTALSEVDKDENNKRFITFDISGKIGKKIPQYFDLVLYLHVTPESERVLITNKTETVGAKDRSGKLDARMPADLSQVMLKIYKKEGKK